jgi:hypothetical protein
MSWTILASIVVALVAAGLGLAYWTAARLDAGPTPVDDAISPDRLRATLQSLGISVGATDIPPPELVAPFISTRDDFVDAVPGRYGGKQAILVLLGGRVVAAASTVGSSGAECFVFRADDVGEVDYGYDIGGQVTFHRDGEDFTFSHIPRRRMDSFRDEVLRVFGETNDPR